MCGSFGPAAPGALEAVGGSFGPVEPAPGALDAAQVVDRLGTLVDPEDVVEGPV